MEIKAGNNRIKKRYRKIKDKKIRRRRKLSKTYRRNIK